MTTTTPTTTVTPIVQSGPASVATEEAESLDSNLQRDAFPFAFVVWNLLWLVVPSVLLFYLGRSIVRQSTDMHALVTARGEGLQEPQRKSHKRSRRRRHQAQQPMQQPNVLNKASSELHKIVQQQKSFIDLMRSERRQRLNETTSKTSPSPEPSGMSNLEMV